MDREEESIRKVTVVGAGQMGVGIGIEFARFGFQVYFYDTKANYVENVMKQSREDLDLMAETGLITVSEVKPSLDRLHVTNQLETAVANTDYVVEAVFDKLALKQELFSWLDQLCPSNVPLATNTTTLRVTDIAANTRHPERVLTTHYFQPPHFIPLVEVVGGEKTSQQIIDQVVNLLRRLGKRVVVLEKDVNALVGARLQAAFSGCIEGILKEGLTSNVKDIDDIISFAFGRRLCYLANFKRLDFMGLDFLYATLKNSGKEIWEPIAQHVEKGEYGMKSGKGFYNWPGDTAQQELNRLKKGLAAMMLKDKEEGTI